MRLKSIELSGFKSFAKKTKLEFDADVVAVVGPNGSGKSNVAESFRFALGEQSMKSMRGRRGEDLIWNGSPASPRAGRASVRLVLDNTDRTLSLDFDEVAIERVVNRDGSHEYRLNGSLVRLRDVVGLLAQANVGASGHHIISQGEADRILSASPRERREMIEDALGLKSYLYRREDAERKLGRAQENIREVEGLRRELAPHVKFLERQVRRIEESESLKRDLAKKYDDYFKREAGYLDALEAELIASKKEPERELRETDAKIARAREVLAKKGEADQASKTLVELEARAEQARQGRERSARELGRLEGELRAHERLKGLEAGATVPKREALSFASEAAAALESALQAPETLKDAAALVLERARAFIGRFSFEEARPEPSAELSSRKEELERELLAAQADEGEALRALSSMRRSIEAEKDKERGEERELFGALARRGELEAALAGFRAREEELSRGRELFKADLGEAAALLGSRVLEWEYCAVRDAEGREISAGEFSREPRARQEERRRALERLKVKCEELGSSDNASVLKEYRDAAERDAFLSRELNDLDASAFSLRKLIEELTATLETRFTSGIAQVSAQFEQFFKIMFGAGNASLHLTSVSARTPRREPRGEEGEDGEEELSEEGIEVAVSLPHKRVKGLHMFSGGERALTSIALIFAMSQVNPPPFLILDETDAALDEANSRRYGDMIETLAHRSQLIVITHNRETMSRAGILYGVTMGGDGVSKLLSVRFEEAAAVAK